MNQYHKNQEYTRDKLHQDRAYGPYWYSGVWSVVRQALIVFCAFVAAFGLITGVIRYARSQFFDPVDAGAETLVRFSVASGSSLSRVAANLENENLIRNRSAFRYYADILGEPDCSC